jgi:DNA-binding transcriptional regulator YiaG
VTSDEFKRMREAAGLTQEKLAERLGVHRVTIARWETGERRIPEMAARLLARIRDDERAKRKGRA